jgi:RNA polymerase sigma-70 factor (ECF subfamily)
LSTDQALIQGCKKGSRKAQEGLYKSYFGFAMSVSLRFAPEREDAIEIVNDSFLKVFEKIRLYDESKPFLSWFRKILVNTALDYFRAKKTYLQQIEYPGELTENSAEPDWNTTLKTDVILKLFKQLPDLHRIIFNLYEVEDYSHDEIAALLHISPGTSRSHLSRAKLKIRQLYTEHLQKEKA